MKADFDPVQDFDKLVKDYGLREWVPEFMAPYQRDAVIDLGGKSAHLWHAAGCLAGDTEIVVNRGGCARRMRLDDLVYKFNGGASGRGARLWDPSIPTYTQSVDEKTGYIVKNRIVAAVESGVKEAFTLITESGAEITATADHRFWTPNGWRKLGDLREGDEVMVEVWPSKKDTIERKRKAQYILVEHMWNHPCALRRSWKSASGNRQTSTVPLHRLVMEAHLNGISTAELVGRIILNKLEGLTFLRKDQHVHHKDENARNNTIENLEVLDAKEHLRPHGTESGWKHVAARAAPTKIVNITRYGSIPTYDLTMEDPHNSFVANGIVVHNSGKTLTSIVWSLCYPGNTLVTTRAAVRRQFGREIERFTKHRALVIETKADCTPEILSETEALFLVLGWEMLPDCVEDILRYFKPVNWIADEMHKCKSHRRWGATPTETGKLKFDPLDNIAHAAMRVSRATKRRLAATATPIKDRVRDLWAQLDLIHPDAWGPFYREDKASFAGRYCAARRGFYGGIETTGSSNLDELWDRVSLVTHHVPHSVTHRHLPPRRRLVTYVPAADQVKATGFAKVMKNAAKGGRGALLEAKLMEAAARKRKAVVEILEECVAAGQKVIVFTGRREDCDDLGSIITDKFGSVAQVFTGHGGTPAPVRDGIQQAYMAAPGPAVLVGTGDAWGECLDPDTMILGANKPLRDCVDGDRVFGEKRVEPSESSTIHPYTGHMVEIKAQGLLPLRSTTGHATLTMAGGVTAGRDRHFEFRSGRVWKNAEDVKPWIPNTKQPAKTEGDFLLVPRLDGTHTNVRFDLKRFVASEEHVRMRETRGLPNELPLDADTAWVLGLYVAEGSSTIQPNGRVRVTLSLGNHERHLADRVVAIMGARGFKVNVRQQKTWLHVTIKSTPLGHLLREITGHGAQNKRMPEEVLLNTDMKILYAFLQGYEEGDGHTMQNGRKVQAATVSKVLALQLQLAIARFGRLASISVIEPKPRTIDGRRIKHQRPFFVLTWRWQSARHDRYKVLDKYIATPVKSVEITPFSGDVGYMSTTDKTMLASNAIVHNGVNLQDTDLLLIAMLPYTPGQVIQWEGRVARHGQKRPVMIQYLVAEHTVDEHVAGILLDKLPAVEKVSQDDSVDGFADQLRGADQEDEILESILSKLAESPA
jgi:hypothetical protein